MLGTYGPYFTNEELDFSDNLSSSRALDADPTPEEYTFLQSVTDLSPGCKVGYCLNGITKVDEVDTYKEDNLKLEGLLQLNPDFLILQGYTENFWGFDDAGRANLTTAFPPERTIYIDLSMTGDNCIEETNCIGKSFIDVVEQHRHLAEFLNLDEPASLNQEFQDLCQSIEAFRGHMKTAQENGVRAMAAYQSPFPNLSFIANPIVDMVLRMFEELGMPIMHPGTCLKNGDCSGSYYWEYIGLDAYFTSCKNFTIDDQACLTSTLYPVDVWLYDHRTDGYIREGDFASVFPDKAVQEKQLIEWPIGGGKFTPVHAKKILDNVGPQMSAAKRLHPETSCTPADVASDSHRTTHSDIVSQGLGGGNYACYDEMVHNPKYAELCSGSFGDFAMTKHLIGSLVSAVASLIFFVL